MQDDDSTQAQQSRIKSLRQSYSVFQQNWRPKRAPITCTLSWPGVTVGREDEEEARKLETYSGAKCSIVERWFPVTGNCFVKCIFKQIIKYSWTCVLIRELGYANPRLFSSSEKKINNTTLGTGAISQHSSSAVDAYITRLLNRLSVCSLSADLLCADLSLTKSRTRLSRQFYWKTLQSPWRLDLPKGPTRTCTSLSNLHLMTETDPVFETMWFFKKYQDDGQVKIIVELIAKHHRQNPLVLS
jgi:hypothetical protein